MLSPAAKGTRVSEFQELKKHLPSDDVLAQCMHCGLCLATCPTYDLTKMERSSPRGRIRMVKAIAEGELEVSRQFFEEMNFCLDCQACETACPAGVHYGQIVEGAREMLSRRNTYDKVENTIKKFALNHVLANPAALRLVSFITALIQRAGVLRFLAGNRLLGRYFSSAQAMLKLLPEFSGKSSLKILSTRRKTSNEGKKRVAFLTGCLMDTAFTGVNLDTVELLEKLGYEVIIPAGQVCCGSLHAHYGEIGKAHDLARKNLKIFSLMEYDYLIANSAGCGAFMKEYGHIFAEDSRMADKATKFSSKVLDLFQFLALPEVRVRFREWKAALTYHDACHLCHTQKVVNEPRKVLQMIPGLDYRPLPESTWCCGSAGIYNIMRHGDSMKFLEKKMENVRKTGAEYLVTANPGCYLQIKYGAERFSVKIDVLHPASLLNRLLETETI